MYSSVKTAALQGIDSINVSCEADVSDGLPVFDLVGFLSTEVRESRERVRTALRNTGINLPAKRITINISPASIRKSGTSFDLPIAASILAAIGVIPEEILHRVIMIGELSLYGDVLPIKGVLPVALSMKDSPLNSQENILKCFGSSPMSRIKYPPYYLIKRTDSASILGSNRTKIPLFYSIK